MVTNPFIRVYGLTTRLVVVVVVVDAADDAVGCLLFADDAMLYYPSM